MFTVSLLEHFSTAKLVMMTSQTPNGSRSAAASDVSSCAFILPHWHPSFPSFSLQRPTYGSRLSLYS